MGKEGTATTEWLGAVGPDRRHGTLSHSVASDIETLILRGRLEAGRQLPSEAQLGDALGVSRSVVRDAVRTLAARGLVDVRQGRGTAVTAQQPETLGDAITAVLMRSSVTTGDVIAAREAIEQGIAGLAAERGTEDDWAGMEQALNGFQQAVRDGDWTTAHREHQAFHAALVSAAHLPALELVVAPLLRSILLLTAFPAGPDDPTEWDVDVHRPILAALRTRDQTAVREALRAHFSDIDAPEHDELRAAPFRAGAQLERYQDLRDGPL
jgi:GntR family transcriptional repressor for pyruvate dehydrogenase complex